MNLHCKFSSKNLMQFEEHYFLKRVRDINFNSNSQSSFCYRIRSLLREPGMLK